ncbi:MAG: HlyD family efflux transporter periplasmic adaptor subunit [Elusimicrobia bacterium]|nr:HlyD family efflux transporter periplasmic adaptor subunit [Elusimicrobiota bacterium]
MQGKWVRWILILAVAGGGVGAWAYYHGKAKDGDEQITYVKVKRGPIEGISEATGYVAPLNRVEIKPSVSGRIEKLNVDEGDVVKAGEVLAEMSSTDRVAILDAARAQGPAVYKKWEDTYLPIPIISPLSGRIILRNVVVGQMVDASTVIYALSDRLVVYAQVDETDIGRIRKGMPARITLDAYPNRVVQARVFDILREGVNNNNVITYNVKIEPVGGAPDYYRSQMTANIDFILKKEDDALLVPAVAVSQKNGGSSVLVPGPDGKLVAKAVTIGIQGVNNDEVLSGLSEGDTVVIRQKRYVPEQAASSPLAGGSHKKSGG